MTVQTRLAPAGNLTGALVAADDPRWRALLERVPADSYHQPGYLSACTLAEEGELRVALVGSPGATVGVPLFLRPLPGAAAGLDACSPYGYACPVGEARSAEQWAAAWQALRRLLANHGVVSAFFRLHPLLSEAPCLAGGAEVGTLVEHGQCVHLRLNQEEDALWAETRPRFRSNISRLQREGWRFVADDWSLFPDFISIYRETMRRAGASGFYYFPEDYFAAIRQGLAGAALLSVLAPDGRPASAGLFLRHGPLVQYHLGGTAEAHAAAAPAKLLFHEARLWYRRGGAEVLHLGGGVGGRSDSLFQFKSGFSKRTSSFHSLRMIVDPERYSALTIAQLGCEPGDPAAGFFPAYRRPLTPSP